MSETGHAINIASGEKLLSAVTAMVGYSPSNTALTVASLTAKLAAASGAIDTLTSKGAARDAAETDRENIFKPLGPLVTKSVGYYTSTGTDQNKIDDAKSFKRKIDGKRASKPNGNGNGGGIVPVGGGTIVEPPTIDPGPKTISSSQQSYVQKAEHFDGLIETYKSDALYAPNETDLKITGLTAYSVQLHGANTTVFDAITDEQNARAGRNLELYDDKSGLVAVAILVKNYVKAVYGATSPQFKQVSKIPFKTIN